MKTKIIFSATIGLLLVLQIISAMSIDINVKPIFNAGEKVSFNYTIFSETSGNIEYTAYVSCPNASSSLIDIRTALLNPSSPLSEIYTYMSSLSESIETQECKAVVWIVKPEEVSKEESFSIQTNPKFDFDILTCREISCNEQTRVFFRGDKVYVSYNSSIEGIIANAIVTYPDDSTRQFSLPGSFDASPVGSYSLEITASKLGYDSISEHIDLGVIAGEANIDYTSLNALVGEKKESSAWLIALSSMILIALSLGIALCFQLIKKKKKK